MKFFVLAICLVTLGEARPGFHEEAIFVDNVSDIDLGDLIPDVLSTGSSGCDCVLWYQCKDGVIITDGAGLIDPRKKIPASLIDDRCAQEQYICCFHNKRPSTTRKPEVYIHGCGKWNQPAIDSRIMTTGRQSFTNYAEYPWQGAILELQGSKTKVYRAGGVLIGDQHVLTVAHRVSDFVSRPQFLTVRLGAWNLTADKEELPRQDFVVEKISIHPDFTQSNLRNDIAVLKLKGTVHFSKNVDSICLPNYNEQHVGKTCIVLGWGKDAFDGKFSRLLKQVPLKVISSNTCQSELRSSRLGSFFMLHQSFMCAGGEQGLDACIGDGGGPLACMRKDGTFSLIGLVSWGIDCGQAGLPGVYVSVVKFLDWIAETADCPVSRFWP